MGALPLILWRAEAGPWSTENKSFKQKGVKCEDGFLFIKVKKYLLLGGKVFV